jgi:zinc/manganese transport system substrate-binding protein
VNATVRAVTAALGLATVVALAACGSPDDSAAQPSAKLSVVATTTQVADFARQVGGDHVTVKQILQSNVDPHDYEPTPADIQAVSSARIVVKNGVGLEKWLDQVIQAAGFTGAVVDTSQGVTLRKGDPDDEETAQGDPHMWHNPQNAKIMAQNIEKALIATDAANTAAYEKNFKDYGAKLDSLDADIERRISSLPSEQRKLVTNHDAFGYYVDRYKLEFIGSVIPSMDTSAELSAKQLADLVAKIRATGTKAIFTESSLPPKTAEAIARQAGVKVVVGEDALYGDTLGPEGSPGATYVGSEQHNTDAIVTALGGS